MRFEVMLETDRIAGRVGTDVKNAPVSGATFNSAEDRWEVEITDLQHLLKLAGGIHWLTILPVAEGEDGELALIEIMDAPDDDEEEPSQEPN